MDILYCDNHLLIVNKPAGIPTQPSLDHIESLEGQAKEWIKKEFNKPGAVFLHAVHRIDKPVSGIVLFARTSKSLSRLNESMRKGRFKKIYKAVVEGILPQDQGVFEDYLIHGEHKALLADSNDLGAKWCQLSYEVLSRESNQTQLQIVLHTGRYHQIRAQMGYRGHPIVGDKKYGAITFLQKREQIGLHQEKISFPHPISDQEITFSAKGTF